MEQIQKNKKKNLNKQLNELDLKLSDIEGSLKDLDRITKGNFDKISQMTDQLDKIRSENSVSKQTQSQKEDELRQLDTQLGMKTTTREALDRQKKKIIEEIQDTTADIEEIVVDNKNLNGTIAKLQSDLRDLKGKLEEEKVKHNTEQSTAKRLEGELNDNSTALENEMKNKVNLDKNKRALEAQIKETQGKLDEAQRSKADLTKKN